MKPRLASLIAVLALVVAPSAHAANVCLTLGAAQVVASGLTVPAKGTCTSFNGFFRGQDRVGMLLAGDICKSSDGTSVMFNTFTQRNGQPDSLIGSWSPSTLTGSGRECIAGAASCFAFNVTLTKCPANVRILPALAASGFQEQSLVTPTNEEP